MRGQWVVVAVCTLGACVAGIGKPPEPDRRLAIHTSGSVFEAPGVRFAALDDAAARAVRVDVRYPVGSLDDPPGKEGLAHLVEHLLFEVELGPNDSIASELGRISLGWNAETAPDATTYTTIAEPGALDAIIGLEVDRLSIGCDGLTPAIFAREREVVLNELREKPRDLKILLHDAVYPAGHPDRRVGTVESVSKLALTDACEFLKGPYRRGTVVVVASGALTDKDLREAAQHNLGQFPARVPGARPAVPAAAINPGIVRAKSALDETHVLATWPLPPRNTREYRILSLVWPFLARELDDWGYTYKWGAGATSFDIGSDAAPVLVLDITMTKRDHVDDAVEATGKSALNVRDMVARGGGEEQAAVWHRLWEARAAALLTRWDTLAGRNDIALDSLDAAAPDARLVVGRVEELANAKPSEVIELVGKWLAPGRTRFVVLEPGGTVAGGDATYRGGAEEHPVHVDGALADKPLPVPAARARLAAEHYALDNGLRVILWPHGTSSVVHGRLSVGAGSAHEPAGADGLAELVGADDVDEDTLTFSHKRLSAGVDELVLAFAGELRRPGLEIDEDFTAFLKQRLGRARSQQRAAYVQGLLTAVYGAGHPYARAGMTEKSAGAIHRDLAVGWARQHVVPKNSVLVLAGQFDADLVRKHIEHDVGFVSAGSATPEVTGDPKPSPIFAALVDEDEGDTVELDILFPGGPGLGVNHAKRLVLQGMIASKLSALRSDKALTYGFEVSYEPRTAGGLWTIHGRVDAHRAAEAATAVQQVLAGLRTDLDGNRGAFVIARRDALQRLLVRSQDASTIASELAMYAQLGAPDDYDDALARGVAGLTLPELQAFIADELAADREAFGAAGSAVPVGRALAAARAAAK